MAEASEDDGGNSNSAGEGDDMVDNAEEEHVRSACCAYASQHFDPYLQDLTELALSQAPHQLSGYLAASLLVGYLQDNCVLVGTQLLAP